MANCKELGQLHLPNQRISSHAQIPCLDGQERKLREKTGETLDMEDVGGKSMGSFLAWVRVSSSFSFVCDDLGASALENAVAGRRASPDACGGEVGSCGREGSYSAACAVPSDAVCVADHQATSLVFFLKALRENYYASFEVDNIHDIDLAFASALHFF